MPMISIRLLSEMFYGNPVGRVIFVSGPSQEQDYCLVRLHVHKIVFCLDLSLYPRVVVAEPTVACNASIGCGLRESERALPPF